MRRFLHYVVMVLTGMGLMIASCALIDTALIEEPLPLRMAVSIGAALAVQAAWRRFVMQPWMEWLRRPA